MGRRKKSKGQRRAAMKRGDEQQARQQSDNKSPEANVGGGLDATRAEAVGSLRSIREEDLFGPEEAEEDSDADSDLPSELVMPRREVELAVDAFLEQEDFSSNWVAKNMPVTSRSLKDGTLSCGKFMVKFRAKFDHQSKSDFTKDGSPSEISIRTVIFLDAFDLARKALPVRFAKQAGCTTVLHQASAFRFACGLSYAVYAYETKLVESGRYSGDAWPHIYKAAADQTCELAAPSMDSMFFPRGKKGTFLRRCVIYDKPVSYFSGLLVDKNLEALRFLRAHQLLALRGSVEETAEGFGQAYKKCWECGKKSSTGGVNQCSCCHVAQYCGKSCQLEAWKTGHREQCQDLKKQHDHFQTSLLIVSAAHDSEMERSICPCFRCDFEALDYCSHDNNMDSHPWLGTKFEHALPIRSVEYYFENLRLIRKGVFWFFPQTISPQAYVKKVCDSTGFVFNEAILAGYLRVMLCYDYSGYLEQQGLPLSAFGDVFEFSTMPKAPIMDRNGVGGMPRLRFLEVHDQAVDFLKEEYEEDGVALRRNLADQSLKKFMNGVQMESENKKES